MNAELIREAKNEDEEDVWACGICGEEYDNDDAAEECCEDFADDEDDDD